MKIISWNVNGIRSLIKKNILNDLLINNNPDIICFTETKLSNDFDSDLFNIYKHKYLNLSIKKGYSGTLIYSKIEPINVTYGLYDIDNEGRMITLEFNNFYLINVYTPNSGVILGRLDWRINNWDYNFKDYIFKLQEIKPVIICGDLNVAHKEIDLKNPKTNLKSAGFTIEERDSFEKLLNKCLLIDTYRYLNPNKIEYSYWSYLNKSRIKNTGWRIDYFLVSKKLLKKVLKSNILTDCLGSDHAPIELNIKIKN